MDFVRPAFVQASVAPLFASAPQLVLAKKADNEKSNLDPATAASNNE